MVPIEQRYATLSVQQLEQMLADRTTEQGELQKALASANTQSIAAQTRPERAQAEISNSQTRIQQIGSILKVGRDNGKVLTADQRNQLSAESAALTALIALRRQELAGNSQLQDLSGSQHDLLLEKTTRQDQEIQDLQTLINQKRLAQSQQTVTEQSIEAVGAAQQVVGELEVDGTFGRQQAAAGGLPLVDLEPVCQGRSASAVGAKRRWFAAVCRRF